MPRKTSLAQLFASMVTSANIDILAADGKVYHGIVQMIEAESGGGACWNVRIINLRGDVTTFFTRTF